ncbi:MAG: tetrahydromethanopterin S-methyltransferase subunit mtrD [Candidatus Methanoperedens nitroreducens]|uniref:Tetrahydromethanopterin S-methyltransferase subunit D n=1 Tax=Candidatus Methanoperedens nitratireducens TaxID=1392998 RepID=A0A0P7ZDS1_9EURY|nr:tetrahydromethanopterin S-methyltransferase subunit D [Candidatus Methanoperedens sp. BLZ2]KAB2945133.1 MAG: tetrahydromethanopterin S-methyltransferase subunit D [Candidatus Methanoperedens sp.]KPQ42846.1 MAG: tetrahydromethanopterin S-methyltransferase subunit mtrD [Candidatus Methanoperedens sp. BLZ1]MBZ0176967.1 tetrahydromethanopterin S-methyltransferase subunit D [Candidatus Methanoperedens nitroreducens]MCX9078147.1 tetrahydromethanopterin S-methyltransferase subunit D [Candidatus Met
MVAIDPTLLTNILLIGLSGTLICLAVHFIPVGGAPAAMAQATGIGTGTVELAAGSGLVGLITAAYMYTNVENAPMALILAAGAVGSMVMLASTMFSGGLIYAYGVAVPFASAQVKKDPITGDRQDTYISKGTQGQGLPTICFVSGIVGAALGGIGGALIYYVLVGIYGQLISATSAAAVAGVFTLGVFYVNAVVPSYGVGGTIEGVHDPKFRRVVGKDIFTSFFVSILCGLLAVLIAGGISP